MHICNFCISTELSLSSEDTYRSANECPVHPHVTAGQCRGQVQIISILYQYPNRGLLFCAKEGMYPGNVTVRSIGQHVCRFAFLLQIFNQFIFFAKFLIRLSPNSLTFWRRNYFFLILAHSVYKM